MSDLSPETSVGFVQAKYGIAVPTKEESQPMEVWMIYVVTKDDSQYFCYTFHCIASNLGQVKVSDSL